MARVDYLNDPNAPKANSIVPAVSAMLLYVRFGVTPIWLSLPADVPP